MQRDLSLLLATVRHFISPSSPDDIKDLSTSGIDGNSFYELASIHGVAPMVYHVFQQLPETLVGADLLNQFRTVSNIYTMRHMVMTTELISILECMEKHHILALPFKGPVLATQLYGSACFRQYSDLDIFIHERDCLRATRILSSQGYQTISHLADSRTMARKQVGFRSTWETKMTHVATGMVVELHSMSRASYVSLLPSFDTLWMDSIEFSMAGNTIRTPSPELTLIMLAEHGARHFWSRLAWICDITRFLQIQQNLDLMRVVERSRECGATRSLLLSLCLATQLFGCRLPERIHDLIKNDTPVNRIASYVHNRLDKHGQLPGKYDQFHRMLHQADLRTGIRYRLPYYQYILRLMLSPTEKEKIALPLPESFAFLHSPFRLLRITFRYMMFLLHMILGSLRGSSDR